VKWLKYFREKQGYSQRVLSAKVGVQENTLWRWENEKSTPSVDIAERIANILGVETSALLNGPAEDVWELKLIFDREGKGVMDLTQGATSSATLEIGDNGMGITLSGAFPLWEDDEKFEDLISQLRKKRATGLKARKEGWT